MLQSRDQIRTSTAMGLTSNLECWNPYKCSKVVPIEPRTYDGPEHTQNSPLPFSLAIVRKVMQ